MGSLLNIVYYVVPFIVLLGILVFVHEFGHFLIARMCGVKVTDFSIGFGKQLWGFVDKHQTNWKICAIPLGGYCQFLGDANGASAGGDDTALKELTEEEKAEQKVLRDEYRAAVRMSLAGHLDNTVIITPDGKRKPLRKN